MVMICQNHPHRFWLKINPSIYGIYSILYSNLRREKKQFAIAMCDACGQPSARSTWNHAWRFWMSRFSCDMLRKAVVWRWRTSNLPRVHGRHPNLAGLQSDHRQGWGWEWAYEVLQPSTRSDWHIAGVHSFYENLWRMIRILNWIQLICYNRFE